jgi:3-ketosteroid 9alpha-monooxygenase subunit B
MKIMGAPADRIHQVFKSPESDPFAAVVIEEDDSERGSPPLSSARRETHEVRGCATPLPRVLDKAPDAPFSCREATRRVCGAEASGEVEMEVNDVLEQQDLDEGLILGCQARPKSDSVEVTYDE